MKLLLVEDNPADVRLIREMLKESLGGAFHLEHSARLDTAVKRLRGAEPFDAVLLDLGLPDSDGMRTVALGQEAAICLPVVVLTGRDDPAFAAEALRSGAQDYLVKGKFDAEVLIRSIRYAIERKHIETILADRTATVERQAHQLRALATELTHAEQREHQRLAKVLHDNIQQLLVAARMQLSLIKRADPAVIRSTAQGVDSILAETLEASRSLTVELCPPVLHQSGLVAALSWLAARMEEQQQFKVRLRADTDAEPGNPDERAFLFEAAREILLNSVKHSGGHEARVTMVRADGSCRIIVEDKGRGFDPASVRPGPSGGFGLFSIQQRLIYLGGLLEIESAPGQGTKATLTIPIGQAVAPEAAPTAPSPERTGQVSFKPKGKKINVLLVDDHKIMRQGLTSLLQFESDIEIVAEAENGQQALELARRHQPDVVIMDVNMPVMSGIEATGILTKEMPQIKIIGLSMHLDGDAANAMREAGAVAYLTKGGPSEDLISAIRAACTV
jgi:DNA-binding NarL/FixJ family response regulator